MLREAAWKRSFAVAQDMQRYVESERAGSVLDLSGEGLSLWTRELAEAVSTQNRAGTRVIRAQQDVCAFVRVRACVPACARVCVCACARARACVVGRRVCGGRGGGVAYKPCWPALTLRPVWG